MKNIILLAIALSGVSAHAAECQDLFVSTPKPLVYRTDAYGNAVGVKRIESLAGRAVEIIDVTDTVSERRAQADPTLKIFNVSDVFENGDAAFMGFGKPNVYLAASIPSATTPGASQAVKFAAKSLKRGDSEIVRTGGKVQSGILVVFKGLSDAQKIRLFESAQKHEGSRRWTCVNANCRVLQDAGFTMNDEPLDKYYFPTPLLRDILTKGLKLDGEKVEYDVVRTTPQYLENVGSSIDSSVAATPVRHAVRAFAPIMKKLNSNVYVVRIRNRVSDVIGLFASDLPEKVEEKKILEKTQVRLTPAPDLKTYSAEVSEPSKFGTLLRLIWGPHALFQVAVPKAEVGRFLPETLNAFPHKKPSFVTKVKKNVLFSKPVVTLVRSQLAARSRAFESLSEKDLFDMLRTDSEGIENRYNIVILGDSIILMKVGIKIKFVDWILSKHVLVSGYSTDVRYAGEIWKSEDGVIHLNGNSGTYMPTPEQVGQAYELLVRLFPNIRIEAHLN